MHIHATGPKNKMPTIIIEAGCGCTTEYYYRLQRALKKNVRVVTYDRAGLGWSEESHESHDARHMVEHLHRLLEKAGIKAPYIFAGHSIAGLIMRVYAGKYPEDVAGMVFIDASHPQIFKQLGLGDEYHDSVKNLYIAVKAAVNQGRSHHYIEAELAAFDDLPEIQRQLRQQVNKPSRYDTALAEYKCFNKSARQAEYNKNLGDIPVVSITAPAQTDTSEFDAGLDTSHRMSVRTALHKELANLSSQGRHLIMDGADHHSIITKEEFAQDLADEILKVVRASVAKR